ncbi:MAG: HAD family hydrolase [Lachnospiraceae bacterium]|nr:HAD family hydrolase [Ruminococcus sp.]MCM1274355.1 HAD family hydrolase [Lachnospiraceae bacterium]
MFRAVLSKKDLSKQDEYYACVRDILDSREVLSLGAFRHHCGTTRLQHSLNVSYYNFLLCRFFKLNAKSAARAGLLHDLFFYDRRTHEKIANSHPAEHANIAFYNASQMFPISELEGDMIINHMWPMTKHLPRHRETFMITLVDKFCAVAEVMTYAARKTSSKVRLAGSLALMLFVRLTLRL